MATAYSIVFDGECHLCSGVVRFIVKRDPGRRFRFAARQSPAGQRLLREAGLAPEQCDSVVVLGVGRAWTQSAAALLILRHLRGLWPVLTVGWLVPAPWRDGLYRWVARNRYRWFGRRTTCLTPTPLLKERFLSD